MWRSVFIYVSKHAHRSAYHQYRERSNTHAHHKLRTLLASAYARARVVEILYRNSAYIYIINERHLFCGYTTNHIIHPFGWCVLPRSMARLANIWCVNSHVCVCVARSDVQKIGGSASRRMRRTNNPFASRDAEIKNGGGEFSNFLRRDSICVGRERIRSLRQLIKCGNT